MSSAMGATPRSKALLWLAALAAIVLLAVPLVTRSRGEPAPEDTPGREVKAEAPVRDSPSPGLPPPGGSSVAPPDLAAAGTDGGVTPGQVSEALPPGKYPVDLEKLRERLPGNLYWELGAPTKDEKLLRKRAEEGQRWNELYGKVLSNTATEEEIHQYYDHRRQVSEDFIAFASLVLQEYGPQLREQERGLYELSIQMHRTRLEEIPRQSEEALARKRLQDQRRETWRGGGPGH